MSLLKVPFSLTQSPLSTITHTLDEMLPFDVSQHFDEVFMADIKRKVHVSHKKRSDANLDAVEVSSCHNLKTLLDHFAAIQDPN